MDKLHATLEDMGLDVTQMDTKTCLDSPPPCFALRESSYAEWLAAALSSPPPLRLDMAAEPNYCRDCSRRFQKVAEKAGACLFPHVRFEKTTEFRGTPWQLGRLTVALLAWRSSARIQTWWAVKNWNRVRRR